MISIKCSFSDIYLTFYTVYVHVSTVLTYFKINFFLNETKENCRSVEGLSSSLV